MHTSEPLVPEPSYSEVEMTTECLERYKLRGTDQIPAELIQPGGNTLRSDIRTFISSNWNTEELSEQWKQSIVLEGR
jgi:hypothetical protein